MRIASRHFSPQALRLLATRVLESFWFVPFLMGLGGAALAGATVWIQWLLAGIAPFDWLRLPIDDAAGRTILGTIAAATISAASVVYSLSLVIRTLAVSTLGPRLVQSFRRNAVTRIALGAQLAVFVFCLVLLVRGGRVEAFRALEIGIAVLGVVAAMALLVLFVNAVAEQVTVDRILGRIAADLDSMIEARLSRPAAGGGDVDRDPRVVRGPVLAAEKDGYVQTIDFAGLARSEALAGRTVALLVRPGDFAVAGQPLARFDAAASPDEPALSDEADAAARASIVFGIERTVTQDPLQSFNLLLEVALRALSPSLNDVFTAIACTHHLAGAFSRLDGRDLSDPPVEPEGGARVLPRATPFAEVVDATLHPLREAASGIPMMALSMLGALEALVATAGDAEARALYAAHAGRLADQAVARAGSAADREAIAEAGERIARLAALPPAAARETFIASRAE